MMAVTLPLVFKMIKQGDRKFIRFGSMGNHKNTLRKTGSMPATYTKWSLRALAFKTVFPTGWGE